MRKYLVFLDSEIEIWKKKNWNIFLVVVFGEKKCLVFKVGVYVIIDYFCISGFSDVDIVCLFECFKGY